MPLVERYEPPAPDDEELLREALKALKFYGNPKNWADDDWGVRSILHGFRGRGKYRGGYGNPTRPAEDTIRKLEERLLNE